MISEEDSIENKSMGTEGSMLFDPSKQRKVRERVAKMRQKNQAN